MKVFLVACLAVAVMAESDPAMLLTPGMYQASGLYPTFHHSVVGSPIVSPISYIHPTVKIMKEQEKQQEEKVEVEMKSAEKIEQPFVYTSSPFINTYINPLKQVVVGPKVVQKNGQVESILHKREAEADPWMVYNTAGVYGLPAVSSLYNPTVYATNKATFYNPFTMDVTGKITNDRVLANNYASKYQYAAQAPGTNTIHLAKREADPLTVVSSPYMYSGLVNPVVNPVFSTPYMYNPIASSPVVYTNPAVVAKSVAKPIVKNAALGMEGVLNGKTVADDAWQFTPNYAGKGMYEAHTPGTDHRARREADPLTIYRSGLYSSYVPRSIVRPNIYSSAVYSYPRTFATPVGLYY